MGDALVIHQGQGLPFRRKASDDFSLSPEFALQDLYGVTPTEVLVLGEIHLGHGSLTQRLDEQESVGQLAA